MRVTFPVPSSRRPVGGIAIIYHLGEALARRGHEVTLLHTELFGGDEFSTVDDLEWFDFDDGITHRFVPAGPPDWDSFPDADVFLGYSPEVAARPRVGLPVTLVQGWRMYPPEQEIATYRAPCPKLCVARWLIDVGRELGVPDAQLRLLRLGIDRTRFVLRRPIGQRRPRVSFCWNVHPMKGAALALATLSRLHDLRPDIAITAFGTARPDHIPPWMTFHHDPAPEVLVDEIYNRTSVFLCASEVEGFGLTNVEAMACGAALVSTDCGGPRDYTDDGRVGLLSPPDDPDALLANVLAFLDDDDLRIRHATEGAALARTFDWDDSAADVAAFFEDYLADPDRYRG